MQRSIKLLLTAAVAAMPAVATQAAWEVKYTFDSEAELANAAIVRNIEESGANATVENGQLKVSFGDLFESTSNLFVLLPLGVDLKAASAANGGVVTVYSEIVQPTVNGAKAVVDTVWGLANIEPEQVLDTRFDSFNVMQRIVVTTDAFESRDGGAYVTHDQFQADTTYRLWWVIDYNLGYWTGYVQGGQWAEQEMLGEGFFGFRATPTAEQSVDHFMFALTAGNIGDPKGKDYNYFDNIAVDVTGENLTVPTIGGGEGDTWADWSDDNPDGWIDTEDFLGRLFIGPDGWVAPQSLNSWIYLPEGNVTGAGAWSYIPR